MKKNCRVFFSWAPECIHSIPHAHNNQFSYFRKGNTHGWMLDAVNTLSYNHKCSIANLLFMNIIITIYNVLYISFSLFPLLFVFQEMLRMDQLKLYTTCPCNPNLAHARSSSSLLCIERARFMESVLYHKAMVMRLTIMWFQYTRYSLWGYQFVVSLMVTWCESKEGLQSCRGCQYGLIININIIQMLLALKYLLSCTYTDRKDIKGSTIHRGKGDIPPP